MRFTPLIAACVLGPTLLGGCSGDDEQYSSRSGGTLEVDPDGKGAEVDVDTDGGVHITASFAC